MKLSFSTRGWPNLSFEEMLDVASDMGFSGVEVYNLSKFNPMMEKDGPFHKYNLGATVRLLKDRGISIPCFDTSIDISSDETAIATLKELIDMGKVSLSERIAYPMYAAISSDTGGFIFSSASADTYRLAAELIETGIDFADINHRLFHSKTKEQLSAEGFISSNITTDADGRIAYAVLSKETREALGLSSAHFETAIDVVRSVLFAEIAIFVRETDEGTVKASLRSTGFNVAEIAAEFGGGGHVRAAGCSIPVRSAEEGAKILIEKIKNNTCFFQNEMVLYFGL